MADITLADYTSYIFIEMVKARQMADNYSREMAEVYAGDPVLKHFSVPRFKLPKLELTIPVLIAGARFKQSLHFNMESDEFDAFIGGLVKDVVSAIRVPAGRVLPRVDPPDPSDPETIPEPEPPLPPPPPKPLRPPKPLDAGPSPSSFTGPRSVAMHKYGDVSDSICELVTAFWHQLAENPDPSQPANIVREMWTRIFEQALADKDLQKAYDKSNPNNELYHKTLDSVMAKVVTNTVVESTMIQSLLINPETNVVKSGSSDTSVFTIKAEMQEEGFFVRTVRDESTGATHPVVEFE
jgi:hypothetical protein